MTEQLPQNPGVYSIGLVMLPGHEHMRQVALGAVEYHRENPTIQIVGDGLRPLVAWERVEQFSGDGLIAIANSQNELTKLKSLGIPFVLAGARFLDRELSVVASDSDAIGRMAGEHFLSIGLKRFLFTGSLNWDYERQRFEGFRDYLVKRNFECEHGDFSDADFPFRGNPSLESKGIKRLASMIKRIKPPLGIFCPNSFIARATLFACDSIGLRVPDQVAVLAVNDDPILCETSDPPLSTIVQASREIGFSAAKLLFSQLSQNQGPRHIFFSPQRLSLRLSSDIFKVGNEQVEAALRYMRDHAQNSIEITDVAAHVGVSRRTLELKFRDTLESTPRQQLLRMRLRIAKSLLAESKIPITEIALRSGFASSQVFSSVFKKECGVTPSQFRIQSSTELESN